MADFRPVLALTIIAALSLSSSAYITSIHAPAVIQNRNVGNLTLITLNLTPGDGLVSVDNNAPSVGLDTVASAQTAAAYASSFEGVRESSYDFNYTISSIAPDVVDSNVSGPSAGLAFTLLAVAALRHTQLQPNFTVTGTINSDGSVGLIGGVYDKVGAAKADAMRYALVPAAPSGSLEELLYYISQQTYGLPVAEVANVSQALPYAFGSASPSPLSINLTDNYNASAAGYSNITCTSCNSSAFGQLVNATFNFTSSLISSASNNFSSAKNQLSANLRNYRKLASAGYLYTAADFSFLNYIDAFTLSNAQNYTSSGAAGLLNNVSAYCSSLVPPPLTTQNYEFVIGGELRQYWANITISNAQQALASEQSTDDIIQSIYTAASAMGWCKASSELYSVAPYMGGSYVVVSPSLGSSAATAINRVRGYGNGLYLQAATQAYNNGDYATALYATTYVGAFSSPLPSVSAPRLYSMTLQNLANATAGTWPSQFATQSEFYFRQSLVASGSAETSYADQAYTTSVLAASLSSANGAISNSFIATNQSGGAAVSQQLSSIEQNISQIYTLLLVNATLMFVVLVVLLFHMLPHGKARGRQRSA